MIHKTITLIICLAIILTSCNSEVNTNPNEIKIGAILSLTNNDLSSPNQAMLEGIELAAEEINNNNNGGINGKILNIIYEDDHLSSKDAVTSSQKLLNVDKVSASLIGLSNTAKSAGAIFEAEKTPLIVLWDSNKDIENIGDYVYSIGFNTEDAGYIMADKLYSKGIRNVAVIEHLDEWSILISRSFIERFNQLGGKVKIHESLEISNNDFKTVIQKSKDTEAIYVPFVAHLAIFFKQAKELNYQGIIATGDSMNNDVILDSNGAAEGVYFTQLYIKENERIKNLRSNYIKKYGREPSMIEFNALGYDGVMVLVEAIKNLDDRDLQESIYKIQGFDGAAGITSFNKEGSASKYEKILVVKNNEAVESN